MILRAGRRFCGMAMDARFRPEVQTAAEHSSHRTHRSMLIQLCCACIAGLFFGSCLSAQRSAPSATPEAVLLARARQLSVAGRPDLAAQAWRQVLLADPRNRAALEGLVLSDRRLEEPAEAEEMTRRLRAVDPADPVLQQPADSPAAAPALFQGADPRLALAQLAARRAGAAEAAAYRVLHRKEFHLAGQMFRAILKRRPRDGPALAGMGFLAMQRQDFPAALLWLQSAERSGLRNSGIRQAIATCRFWISMNKASAALAANQPQDAEAAAQAALAIEPGEPNATLLLARIFEETGRTNAASALYRRVIERHSGGRSVDAAAWAGLLQTSTALGQSRAALAAVESLSASAQASLQQNVEYLAALSKAYAAAGRTREAEAALASALALSAVNGTPSQRTGIALEYAALCVEDHQYDCAGRQYRQLIALDPANLAAWQGRVLAQHLQGNDARAWQTAQEMPAEVRALAMNDSSFLMLLAGIEQSQGKLVDARARLIEAERLFARKGEPPAIGLLQQLAGVDIALQQPQSAIPLYRAVLTRAPNDAGAWTGLLSALHQAGKDRQAEQAERQMPTSTRSSLERPSLVSSRDSETYFETMAGVEQSLGNLQAALAWLTKIDVLANASQSKPPVDVELQEAWLEYNLNQNREADASVERLRNHLRALRTATADQRAQVDDLTANLAVRRAAQQSAAGNRTQAVQILDAAAQQVGGNLNARTRLATGYLTAGEPTTSIAIYQSLDMRKAAIGDLKAAIGAAIEVKRMNLAESWLQQALAVRPSDPGLLLLAGEFSRSNGNLPLAKKYLRAVLATQDAKGSNLTGAERQAAVLLASIQAAYSGWLAASAYLNHFTGTSGTTEFTDIELPVEASMPAGDRTRITAVVRTVHLNSGAYNGIAGQPLGTLNGLAAAPAVPMTGMAASLQFATRTFSSSIGITPIGFPVMNLTGAVLFHAQHNPWTVSFSRDSIRQSQLAYAGLHDPAQPAKVWGGVLANLATAQYAQGDANSGWYATATAGAVTGRHVRSNPQVTGDAGAYWQAWSRPSASLRAGVNFYGQHDAHNELFFSYGHGGYFSPRYFLLPAVPLTLMGHSGDRWHYELVGSLGPQIFKEASAPYFPFDPGLQSARGNPIYPAQSTLGLNYGAQAKVDYLLGRHWKLDAFFSANNAAKYNQQIGGVSLHYLFRRQSPSQSQSAPWFPYSGLRPYLVPQ